MHVEGINHVRQKISQEIIEDITKKIKYENISGLIQRMLEHDYKKRFLLEDCVNYMKEKGMINIDDDEDNKKNKEKLNVQIN